jgi:ketosteroid isomerase-like protein
MAASILPAPWLWQDAPIKYADRHPAGATMSAADATELNAIRERVSAAENSGRFDLMKPDLAEDVIVMAPGLPAVVGIDAATAFMEGFFAQFTLAVEYHSEEIVVMGDWAFDRGTAWQRMTPKAGGLSIEEPGKYLWLYRRDRNGAWKHARVTWNPSVMPGA